jgi:hypothetical protein
MSQTPPTARLVLVHSSSVEAARLVLPCSSCPSASTSKSSVAINDEDDRGSPENGGSTEHTMMIMMMHDDHGTDMPLLFVIGTEKIESGTHS